MNTDAARIDREIDDTVDGDGHESRKRGAILCTHRDLELLLDATFTCSRRVVRKYATRTANRHKTR